MNLRPEQGGRGRGIAAAIEGFFAAMWFGWAQAEPPGWLVPLLIAGSVAGVALLVVAVVLAVRGPSGSTPMSDPKVRKRYNLIVGIECLAIFAGAAILGQVAPDYIAAWIAFVVGVHFVPMGSAFGSRELAWSGWAIAAVAVVAAVVAAATDTNSSTIAGAGSGLLLLATGALTVFRPAALPEQVTPAAGH